MGTPGEIGFLLSVLKYAFRYTNHRSLIRFNSLLIILFVKLQVQNKDGIKCELYILDYLLMYVNTIYCIVCSVSVT